MHLRFSRFNRDCLPWKILIENKGKFIPFLKPRKRGTRLVSELNISLKFTRKKKNHKIND